MVDDTNRTNHGEKKRETWMTWKNEGDESVGAVGSYSEGPESEKGSWKVEDKRSEQAKGIENKVGGATC